MGGFWTKVREARKTLAGVHCNLLNSESWLETHVTLPSYVTEFRPQLSHL